MKKTSYILTAAILILAIASFACSNTDSTAVEKKPAQEAISPTIDSPMQEAPSTEERVQEAPLETKTPGTFESYTPEKVASAQGKTVLFFHASWCPSCRGLNKNIEENLNDIPNDLTILKVDFDKETELKKKYGVTTQHTLVQVDNDGTLLKKWSGGSSLEILVSQVR